MGRGEVRLDGIDEPGVEETENGSHILDASAVRYQEHDTVAPLGTGLTSSWKMRITAGTIL